MCCELPYENEISSNTSTQLMSFFFRAWACAMQLKQDSNTETRKKFHMISRLKKALAHGNNLVKLAEESERIDARTKLECEAYTAFITATYHFETEEWKEAIEAYKKTQYERIG